MKKTLLLALVAVLPTWAQNIVGTWQGTLPGAQGRPALRVVAKLSRADDESLKAVLYSVDQNGAPMNASAVTLQGATLKMTIPGVAASYEGKLSGEGKTIAGTMTLQAGAVPMEFVRATNETAWAIPEPPPPPKVMAADGKPAFEVSTVKPSRPDAEGRSILVGRGGTNLFTTTNTPLKELILMAYGVHPRQIVGAPAWVESERFDITAKPDRDGVPNMEQLTVMVQDLLADRFQLKFHKEKKELAVYAITVAKGGAKLTKSDPGRSNLPGFGGRPGLLNARNSTMEQLAAYLQRRILEQPVVDQTGLTDHFDLTLRYTPDAASLAQAGPDAQPPAAMPDGEAPPDLFGAFVQQLGLKLESTKAPVDVLVIDHVEKPSAN